MFGDIEKRKIPSLLDIPIYLPGTAPRSSPPGTVSHTEVSRCVLAVVYIHLQRFCGSLKRLAETCDLMAVVIAQSTGISMKAGSSDGMYYASK